MIYNFKLIDLVDSHTKIQNHSFKKKEYKNIKKLKKGIFFLFYFF